MPDDNDNNGGNPPADEGFTPAQETRLKEMLGELAKSLTPAPATQTPPSPATAGAAGGSGGPSLQGAPADLAATIEAVVGKMLNARDEEDRVAIMEAEIADLREKLPKPAQRGWGAFLLGMPR